MSHESRAPPLLGPLQALAPPWVQNLVSMFASSVTYITNIFSRIPVQADKWYFITSPILRECLIWAGPCSSR